MLDLTPGLIAILVACALMCGLAKTALPGLACIPVAILAAVMPTRPSTALMLLMLLTGDLLAIWIYRKDADWKVLRGLFPPVAVGVAIGAIFLAKVSNQVMKVSIGIIILALTALTLGLIWYARRTGRDLATSMSTSLPARLFYGSLSGFTTMAANSGGPVVSLYFLASRFEVRRFMGTQAWFFFIVNLLKLPFSAGIGLIDRQMLLIALCLAPLVLGAALLGRWWIGRIDNKIFDPIVTALTIVSAVFLLL